MTFGARTDKGREQELLADLHAKYGNASSDQPTCEETTQVLCAILDDVPAAVWEKHPAAQRAKAQAACRHLHSPSPNLFTTKLVASGLRVSVYAGPARCNPKRTATSGKSLSMRYSGTIDASSAAGKHGKQFDSSDLFNFTLGRDNLIAGWEQGLVGLCEGSKATLVIPPHLAYGDEGFGEAVPSNATLHFDVELVKVTGEDDADHSVAAAQTRKVTAERKTQDQIKQIRDIIHFHDPNVIDQMPGLLSRCSNATYLPHPRLNASVCHAGPQVTLCARMHTYVCARGGEWKTYMCVCLMA